MDNLFLNRVIIILSPQPWNYLFISKHHYARELSKNNSVYYIGPPSNGRKFIFSCACEDANQQLKIVSYTVPSPDWLRFKLPGLYKKVVRFYLSKVLKSFVGKADVCFDFGCYQQFDSIDFVDAQKKIFFPVDDMKHITGCMRGCSHVFSV